MGGAFPLFCCCWGERAHIHTERSLSSPIHTHTTPSLLSPSTRTYTHTHPKRYNIKEPTLPKDYFSHTLAPQSGSVPLSPPPACQYLVQSKHSMPSSFHTWRGSLSQAIADKLQTRQPPFSPSLLRLFFLPPLSRPNNSRLLRAPTILTPHPSCPLGPPSFSFPPSPPLASSLSLSFSPTYPPHSPLSL